MTFVYLCAHGGVGTQLTRAEHAALPFFYIILLEESVLVFTNPTLLFLSLGFIS